MMLLLYFLFYVVTPNPDPNMRDIFITSASATNCIYYTVCSNFDINGLLLIKVMFAQLVVNDLEV